MKFSIVIPTYNEEEDIRGTLEALLSLDYQDKEIIIVDDSTDKTPDIVKEYAKEGVRLIHPGGGGRCEARNIGIQAAEGEIVCVLNADVLLPVDFLKKVEKKYQKGADFVLVSSKVKNTEELFARYVDCVSLKEEKEDFLINPPKWTEGFTCRKSFLIEAGLFPAGFPVAMYAGEDVYLAEQLLKIGAKREVDFSIVVEHIAPASFSEYWRFRKSRGQACPQYRRYINRWSLPKITLWNTLKVAFFGLKLFTLIYPIWFCWKISAYSFKGRKDFPFLLYAWFIEQIAFHYGLFTEILVIQKKEKLKHYNFKTGTYNEC